MSPISSQSLLSYYSILQADGKWCDRILCIWPFKLMKCQTWMMYNTSQLLVNERRGYLIMHQCRKTSTYYTQWVTKSRVSIEWKTIIILDVWELWHTRDVISFIRIRNDIYFKGEHTDPDYMVNDQSETIIFHNLSFHDFFAIRWNVWNDVLIGFRNMCQHSVTVGDPSSYWLISFVWLKVQLCKHKTIYETFVHGKKT